MGIGLREPERAYSRLVGGPFASGIILKNLFDRANLTYGCLIREWCFGSFDGAYDGTLFMGIVSRIFNVDHKKYRLSHAELVSLVVDTAGWEGREN